jgi:hypothetical protein
MTDRFNLFVWVRNYSSSTDWTCKRKIVREGGMSSSCRSVIFPQCLGAVPPTPGSRTIPPWAAP